MTKEPKIVLTGIGENSETNFFRLKRLGEGIYTFASKNELVEFSNVSNDWLKQHNITSEKVYTSLHESLNLAKSLNSAKSLTAEDDGLPLLFDNCDKEFTGVLYHIGTNGGKEKYQNPFRKGDILMRWSNDAPNYYSLSTGHKKPSVGEAGTIIRSNVHPGDNATMWSAGSPNAYFQIDISPKKLRINHYCYRGDAGGGENHPRTWSLQGSCDGKTWNILKRHKNDNSVQRYQTGSFPVENSKYYSHFRIQNEGNPNHLCCSGIEFYGYMKEEEKVNTMKTELVKSKVFISETEPAEPLSDASSDEQKLATAGWNGDKSQVKMLLANGARPDAALHGGHSALNGAARNGHLECLRMLIDAGGSIESRCLNPWRCTPLHQTAYHGQTECARLL